MLRLIYNLYAACCNALADRYNARVDRHNATVLEDPDFTEIANVRTEEENERIDAWNSSA